MKQGDVVRVAGRWKGKLRDRINSQGGWWVDWARPEPDPESPRGRFWSEDEMRLWDDPPLSSMPKTVRRCHVVNEDCRAAASGVSTRGTCYACGNPVCSNRKCSRVRQWEPFGRRRVCAGCDEEEELYSERQRKRRS